MAKQIQKFTQFSTRGALIGIATITLFFYSCKKKVTPEITTPTHRVTFDSKDGTAVSAITVKTGDTLTLPVGPTKTGFTFGGWYTDSRANTTPFLASTTITSDLTLYAKWNVFSLSSTSFADRGKIPPRYAKQDYFSRFSYKSQADRLNISPQLSWTNAPPGTTSFLIIMQSNAGDSNWVVYNIPPNKTSLAENELSTQEISFCCRYKGPCGIEGATYIHKITIFALDLPENYFNDEDYNDNDNLPPLYIEKAKQQLKNHILASASITGTYTPKYCSSS